MDIIREEDLIREAEKSGVIARRGFFSPNHKPVIIEGSISDLIALAAKRQSILVYTYINPEIDGFYIDSEAIGYAWESYEIYYAYDLCQVFSESFLDAVNLSANSENEPKKQKKAPPLSSFEQMLLDECLAYNNTVKNYGSSDPIGLLAFVPVDGFAITVSIGENEEDENKAINAFKEILSRHKEELEEYLAEKERKQHEGETKLRIMLLKDKDFLNATNKSLRKRCAQKYWRGNEWIRCLFDYPPYISIRDPSSACLDFFEYVFSEYKNDKTVVDRLQEDEGE